MVFLKKILAFTKKHGGRRLTNSLASAKQQGERGERTPIGDSFFGLNQSKGFLDPDYFALLKKKNKIKKKKEKVIACIFYQSVVFKSLPCAERKPPLQLQAARGGGEIRGEAEKNKTPHFLSLSLSPPSNKFQNSARLSDTRVTWLKFEK